MTAEEIRYKHKALHDELSDAFYAGTSGLTKEEFDLQHGRIWADMEAELIAEGYLTPPAPPLCTHWAIIDSFSIGREKPVRVTRTWEGKEYQVDCYVTESVKDQFQASDIAVGDYVMVEFLDDDPNRATVFAKVFKTW